MRVHIRTALVVLLTLGLVALFLRNADLRKVQAEIGHARVSLLLMGLLVTVATYLLRALRWQYLLRPIGPTRFATAFRATVIGFAAIFLLPARAGEFIRPYLLARREHLSVTATFATIVLERLLDLLTVLLLLASFLLLFDPGMGSVNPRIFGAIKLGGIAIGAGALAGLGLVFMLAGHPEKLGRAALRIERVLPARATQVVARLVQMFAEGLAVMRRPTYLLIAMALSLPLWMSLAAGVWLVAQAFHITLPYTGSFLLLALLVVGVAVPTPGGVGSFHEAFRIGATAFYGVSNDRAVGAAIVLHALSFVPVTLIGIAFMAQDGLNLRGVGRLASTQGETGGSLVTVEPREERESTVAL